MFQTAFSKLKTKISLSVSFSALMLTSLFSSNAMACDDKACETAYLASTQQYVYNQRVHAEMYRAERLAYAKIRENRDFALYMHIHQTKFGKTNKK